MLCLRSIAPSPIVLPCIKVERQIKRAKENAEFTLFMQQEHLFPAADGSIETVVGLVFAV